MGFWYSTTLATGRVVSPTLIASGSLVPIKEQVFEVFCIGVTDSTAMPRNVKRFGGNFL